MNQYWALLTDSGGPQKKAKAVNEARRAAQQDVAKLFKVRWPALILTSDGLPLPAPSRLYTSC